MGLFGIGKSNKEKRHEDVMNLVKAKESMHGAGKQYGATSSDIEKITVPGDPNFTFYDQQKPQKKGIDGQSDVKIIGDHALRKGEFYVGPGGRGRFKGAGYGKAITTNQTTVPVAGGNYRLLDSEKAGLMPDVEFMRYDFTPGADNSKVIKQMNDVVSKGGVAPSKMQMSQEQLNEAAPLVSDIPEDIRSDEQVSQDDLDAVLNMSDEDFAAYEQAMMSGLGDVDFDFDEFDLMENPGMAFDPSTDIDLSFNEADSYGGQVSDDLERDRRIQQLAANVPGEAPTFGQTMSEDLSRRFGPLMGYAGRAANYAFNPIQFGKGLGGIAYNTVDYF